MARVVKHAEFLAAVSDTQNGLIKGSHTGSESRGKLTAFRAAVEKNIFLSFHFPSPVNVFGYSEGNNGVFHVRGL